MNREITQRQDNNHRHARLRSSSLLQEQHQSVGCRGPEILEPLIVPDTGVMVLALPRVAHLPLVNSAADLQTWAIFHLQEKGGFAQITSLPRSLPSLYPYSSCPEHLDPTCQAHQAHSKRQDNPGSHHRQGLRGNGWKNPSGIADL